MYRDELGRFARRVDLDPDSELPNYISSDTNSHTSTISQHEGAHVRTHKDYLHPTRTATLSCIIFPPNAPHMAFKPGMIQLLPTFHGLKNKNPYVHVREFEEVVATFHSQPNALDITRLKFFPFSLNE